MYWRSYYSETGKLDAQDKKKPSTKTAQQSSLDTIAGKLDELDGSIQIEASTVKTADSVHETLKFKLEKTGK